MTADRRASVPDDLGQFAALRASRLLGKLAFQVRHASRHPNEEAIHDLRVSIRRLSQCLREFRRLFPKRETKKILKELDRVMDLAAEMRNRDIAIKLIGKNEAIAELPLISTLRRERDEAKRSLTLALVHWRRRDFSRKWRPWLVV